MIDYLIIGSGLAGISFSEIALQNNKSILVLADNSQNSSKIAAGLYNPVVLKRFSEVGHAKEHLLVMNAFLLQLEEKLNSKIDIKTPAGKVNQLNSHFFNTFVISLVCCFSYSYELGDFVEPPDL